MDESITDQLRYLKYNDNDQNWNLIPATVLLLAVVISLRKTS